MAVRLKFWKERPVGPIAEKPSLLRVTQNKLGDDGKPGMLEVPGVVSTNVMGNHLYGVNRAGDVLVVVPISEVALAIVSEK